MIRAFAHTPPETGWWIGFSVPAWRLSVAAVATVLMLLACSGADPARPHALDVAELRADVEASLTTVDPADRVRSVLVWHRGEPVLERYEQATPADYVNIHSITKCVMTTLIGIALHQGDLRSVHQTLGELLPSYRREMTPDVAGTTLHQLLTHTGGFPNEWNGSYVYWTADHWIRQLLSDRASAAAGTGRFAYSHADAHLLSAILVEVTGQSVLEYARGNLFEPLGIPSRPAVETPLVMDPDPGQLDPLGRMEYALTPYRDADFAWPVDPQGLHEGSYSLRLRPQDLLKLGQLYLAGGRWDGRQLATPSFLHDATSEQVGGLHGAGFFSSSYGYLWWLTTVDEEPAFFSYGYGGQFLAVVPGRELIVVMTVDYDPRDPAAEHELITGEAALHLLRTAIAPHFEEQKTA